MPDAVDRSLLDVGDRVAEEFGDLDPQRRGVAAEHGQHRLANGRSLLGTEPPLGEGGQLDAEERVGILEFLPPLTWRFIDGRGSTPRVG